MPNLRAIVERRSHDVAIVGIHSPETPYGKTVRNDNSFALWNAYGVSAWPTQLIFDRHGRWRKTIVGDSQDDDLNVAISALVNEQ